MKVIYESGDLVARSLILKKNTSVEDDPNTIKSGDKMGLLGWMVGWKTDKADIYEGAAIIFVNLKDPHKIEKHHYVGDLTCEGGIPNIPSEKGLSLILGDEQQVSPMLRVHFCAIPEIVEREKSLK